MLIMGQQSSQEIFGSPDTWHNTDKTKNWNIELNGKKSEGNLGASGKIV